MTSAIRKKLIEVALPLEAINKEALHRKQKAPKGFPTSIHKYWAQRPIAICIAVLFGQLVDDPSAWPERFKGEEAQEAERQRLFCIIEQLVLWENSTNELVLSSARWEIARSVAWGLGEEPPEKSDGEAILAYLQEKAPPVYDPFCGGGSIPLEAQRLGLRAYGSDLNPLAVLISKALVEIPPKFSGMPPVNPEAHGKLAGSGKWNGKGAQGLADDVRYYGKWMRDEAAKEIGGSYPQIEVTEEAVREQPSLQPLKGENLTVIAWLWARTVVSPNPAAGGAHVPLVSSYVLSNKEGKKVWLEPILDSDSPDGYRFEVRSGALASEDEKRLKGGNKNGRGSFSCILTGAPMTYGYIDDQANAGKMSTRLMAIVAEGKGRRVYLRPSSEHEEIATNVVPKWKPDQPCRGTFASNAQGRVYGFKTFADYFTPRQLLGLTTFCDLLTRVREHVCEAAGAAGLSEGKRLANGGRGAEAYADAVTTYLAFAIDRMAFYGSSLVGWLPKDNALGKTMPRQALAMSWDYAEGNPFGKSSGDILTAAKAVADCLDTTQPLPAAQIQMVSAKEDVPLPPVLVSTDPPYYDNVSYADLSDFFYVWLRPSLRGIWPDLCSTLLVPKSDELIAERYRHDGQEAADNFFMSGMKEALKRIIAASVEEQPHVLYYAFKQSEAQNEGVASTGWASFLSAVIDGGLAIDGTWPMKSEGTTRAVAQGSNALASSIVLVCRKRPVGSPVITRAAFLSSLKRELPNALKLLQAGNIAPVDLAQASIGPGMGIFSRHSKVLEADDSSMSVKTALQLINQALDDYLSEQESEYDAQTRFAITWFETHGMDSSAYGDAETLAKARNVSVSGVADSGLLESKGGKVRLLKRSELDAKWDPLTDKTLTVWECAQHLIRVLESDGETAAAGLLVKLGSRADATRDLAYRLYQICERKKWADEARAYNGLVVAWPELQKLASQQASAATPAPAQATLI